MISGIVSIDYVHCQSKFTTIYHGSYAVNTLKVEIETVKGRKMRFSHLYHSLHRLFGAMAFTTMVYFELGRVEKMFYL